MGVRDQTLRGRFLALETNGACSPYDRAKGLVKGAADAAGKSGFPAGEVFCHLGEHFWQGEQRVH